MNIGLKSLYITLSCLRQKLPEKSGVQVSAGILHLTLRCSSNTNSTNANNIASTKCRSSPCRGTCTAALKHRDRTSQTTESGTWKPRPGSTSSSGPARVTETLYALWHLCCFRRHVVVALWLPNVRLTSLRDTRTPCEQGDD